MPVGVEDDFDRHFSQSAVRMLTKVLSMKNIRLPGNLQMLYTNLENNSILLEIEQLLTF